jgi:hypothetical protein
MQPYSVVLMPISLAIYDRRRWDYRIACRGFGMFNIFSLACRPSASVVTPPVKLRAKGAASLLLFTFTFTG